MTNIQQPPAWADGVYSIKRHGCTITDCDFEPVQTPGCIQSHGMLLVLRPSDLTIVQISENSAAWLGQAPDAWLGQPVAAALGEANALRLDTLLRTEPVERNPIFAFSLLLAASAQTVDVSVHTCDGVAIVELEAGEPLDHPPPNYYDLLKKTVSRLQTAATISSFCASVTREIRAMTGLDRVMVYHFHPDLHGEVLAESKREGLSSWRGLHYPAQDIPKPARDIFQQIWIRPLPDIHAPLFELVPLRNPDTGKPLNMTHCTLRGASVMYTEYLQNMGVQASLTMPIRRDQQLWGLIACHHYQAHAMPYQIRAACEFLAQIVSVLMASIEEREHFNYRLSLHELHGRLITAAAQQGDLGVLIAGTPNLLGGIAASGAALYQHEHWLTVGQTPDRPQLSGLAHWLAGRPEWQAMSQPVYATDCLSADYPAAQAFAASASGVLAIGLSSTSPQMLLWFRPETMQTIAWAGNPDDKPTVTGPNGPRLCPRTSFELFRESVRFKALPWKTVEIRAALELRVNIMQVVVGWAERLAELNAELQRSNQELDTFAYVASHDLKEPLRGISKYVHQLLSSAVSSETEARQRLERMAVLTQRMDSLLESLLNYSRIGRTQLAKLDTDLNEVVAEALDMVCARRDENQADIVLPRCLPTVACDRVRVREIFCNLISNALKYNDKPRKRIEIGYLSADEFSGIPVPMADADSQDTVFYVRDNGIGIQPRHHEQVFKMFKRLHGRDEYGGGTGAGLAIVQMLVERHQGRIWLDSRPGEETTFYFTLPQTETRGRR